MLSNFSAKKDSLSRRTSLVRTTWPWGVLNIQRPNDIFQLHDTVYQASGHCRGSAKRLVDAAEVIEHEVERQRVAVVLKLFRKRIGKNRRIDIRMVKFRRSAKDVLMRSGSGLPMIGFLIAPSASETYIYMNFRLSSTQLWAMDTISKFSSEKF